MLPRHHTEQIGDHVEAHIVGGTENARHSPEIAGAARSVGRQRTVEGQRRYPIDPILPEQPDRQIAERVESRASPLLPQQEEEQYGRREQRMIMNLMQADREKPQRECDYICPPARSEEHTSELQSLMRISYAVICLHK